MNLPSMRSLEVMVAVAKTGSLAAAAREIGMSVPALSRRLAQLEDSLGVRLFARLPRGVSLTENGESYLARIAPVLQELRNATATVKGRRANLVRVTTIPAFATRWLLPRLRQFELRHSDLDIDIHTSVGFEDLESRDMDIAIRLAPQNAMLGTSSLPIDLLPVWSPADIGDLQTPDDLARQILIGPDHRPEFWQEWLRVHGLAGHETRIRKIDSLLLYQRAMTGAGVAIGIQPLVDDLLAQRRLTGMVAYSIRSERCFHIVPRKGNLSRPVRLLLAWLTHQDRANASALP